MYWKCWTFMKNSFKITWSLHWMRINDIYIPSFRHNRTKGLARRGIPVRQMPPARRSTNKANWNRQCFFIKFYSLSSDGPYALYLNNGLVSKADTELRCGFYMKFHSQDKEIFVVDTEGIYNNKCSLTYSSKYRLTF